MPDCTVLLKHSTRDTSPFDFPPPAPSGSISTVLQVAFELLSSFAVRSNPMASAVAVFFTQTASTFNVLQLGSILVSGVANAICKSIRDKIEIEIVADVSSASARPNLNLRIHHM